MRDLPNDGDPSRHSIRFSTKTASPRNGIDSNPASRESRISRRSMQATVDTATVPKKGLQLKSHLPFESWLRLGCRLSATANSSAWCLGDWLAYGMANYADRYHDAIELTSIDYQTLRNYVWVARSFTMSRRRDKLSFGHHAEVAALPEVEQDFWLRKAEELRWSRNRLRQEVRASLKERRGQLASREESTDLGPCCDDSDGSHLPTFEVKLVLKISVAQKAEFEQAAAIADLTVDTWATEALQSAAHEVLDGDGFPHIRAVNAGPAVP